MERSKVPGAQVAVVSGGKTVYTGAFGVKDVRTGDKVDDSTLFEIASMSKPISATVIAKALTDDPNLSWSSAVHDLLPTFEMGDPYVTAHATVGDYSRIAPASRPAAATTSRTSASTGTTSSPT
jgi:CubicO group peptidase (beta-lactamase class C family)